MHSYAAEELRSVCESGVVEGFDTDLCDALIKALGERSNATALHFKPTKNGKRKRKDPNDPKGAKNAYIFFTMDESVRKEISDAHPGISRTEMTKLIGQKWGNLTDAQKQPYQEMSVKDKERYDREMSERSSSTSSNDAVVAAASGAAAEEPPAKKARKSKAEKADRPAKKAKKTASK